MKKIMPFLLLFSIISSFFFNCKKAKPEDAKIVFVESSSFLKAKTKKRRAEYLIDKKVNKFWCEGLKNDGIGESFTVIFDRDVELKWFYIWNGYGLPPKYLAYNRVKNMKIDDQKVRIKDLYGFQKVTLKEPVDGDKLRFEIASVYKGSKYPNTCISEISFKKETENAAKIKNYVKFTGEWRNSEGIEAYFSTNGECKFRDSTIKGGEKKKTKKCTWIVKGKKAVVTWAKKGSKAVYIFKNIDGQNCIFRKGFKSVPKETLCEYTY